MRLSCLLATALVLLLPSLRLTCQAPDAVSSLASRMRTVLERESSGHSPTPEEIASFDPIDPLPTPPALTEAMPFLLKALQSPDTSVRQLALTTLGGLQTAAPLSDTAAASPALTAAAAYKPDLAQILTPAIPVIAIHLTDESQPNRLQTAIDLGGFTPDPPPSVYPPLLAYLKRDDAVGTVGQIIVSDLLQLGPVGDATADAISRFLRRSDQTASSRSDLVDAIASKPNQSQSLNKTLLTYLSSDDPGLRSRVILSLPQLDLAPEVFGDAKATVARISNFDPAGGQESLQVITAAKAISTCWTGPHMTTGCPVY